MADCINRAKTEETETKTGIPPPVEGLKKGETPQQYVARQIELDLGDF